MMALPRIDHIVERVKHIVDGVRCPCCDHCVGTRMRLACGNSVCNNCLSDDQECLFCTSTHDSNLPIVDVPLLTRMEHALQLLKTCEEAFNVDVFKRKRISEQLEIERKLFPNCVQAPLKYYNKRKLSNVSKSSEKAREHIPGEEISSLKMDNNKYVLQWLDKKDNEILGYRAPLSNINVNNQELNVNLKGKRKISKNFVKSSSKKSRIDKNDSPTVFKRQSRSSNRKNKNELFLRNKQNSTFEKVNFETNNEDESGIVIEDDTIVIEESQNDIMDKDKLALLAVLEADNEQNEKVLTCDSSIKRSVNNIRIHNKRIRIPFYKKSVLLETCSLSTYDETQHEKCDTSNNVSVYIENNNVIATITVSKNIEVKSGIPSYTSIPVQTDISSVNMNNINNDTGFVIEGEQFNFDCSMSNQNQNIVMDSGIMNKSNTLSKEIDHIVIDESDSTGDSQDCVDINESLDCDVLTTFPRYGNTNRSLRKRTPASSDSSEKENVDPNRIKKNNFGKKSDKKKHAHKLDTPS